MIRTAISSLVLCAVLAGCADENPGPSPEQLQERDFVARQACIGERLAQRAEAELQTLMSINVAPGPLAFQQAYSQHANLRLAAAAQLDSALNHARTPEDSARYEASADRFQIRTPEAESVEENVIRSYEANFASIFNDADHPCNWESELEGAD